MKIEERKTLKLPGQTSLFFTLGWGPERDYVLPIFRQLPIRHYHKETQEWEVPIDKLTYILDSLYINSIIPMKVLEEAQASSFIIPEMNFKTNPYGYQWEGIQYGVDKNNWLLLDDMGLGKTLQMIYLAEVLQKTEGLKHCMIICGVNSLKWNWINEIKRHSKLDCYLLGQRFRKNGNLIVGSTKDRADDLMGDIKEFFIITNIETIREDKVVKALIKNKNDIQMMVFDECHKAKGYNTQQGKNFLKLTFPKRKIALTGTLLLNNPLDAYTPLKWIGAEKSSNYQFKQNYCVTGGFGGYQIIGYKNLEQLNNQIKSCSLRRLKEDVLDLPEKTYQLEYVEMGKVQKDFYNNVIEGILDEIDKVVLDNTYEMAVKIRLRQATAWTGILSSDVQVSAKLDRLEELVEDITGAGHKVLVFSTFKETLKEAQRRLNKYGATICDGGCKDAEINERVDAFNTKEHCKVMLATWQKMGTGFTMTAASYVIFIDVPFTDGLYQQAVDRIYRIGQKNAVTAINLITKDTYDERVQDIIEGKKAISDFVIDDKVSAKDILRSMIIS